MSVRSGDDGVGAPAPWRRLLAVALVAPLLPAACASSGTNGVGDEPVVRPVAIGDGLVGNYLAGRLAHGAHDTRAAAQYLERALAQDPDNPDLLRRTFIVHVSDGRLAEGLPLAERLLTLAPQESLANMALVVEDIRAGRFAAADVRLEGQRGNGIDVFMVPLLRAWARVGLGDIDGALKALESLAANKAFAGIQHLHTALVAHLGGRNELAEKEFLTAAGDAAPSLRLTQLLGTFYERIGEGAKAAAVYERYRRDNPQSRLLVPAEERSKTGEAPAPLVADAASGAAEALFGVAGSLRQQNARDTALVFGRMALHLKPSFPIAQILIADILESSRRLEAANEIYAKIDPASPFAWSGRLRIAHNLNSLSRTDEAIDRLKAMAAESSGNPEPLIDLGDILRGHERFAEAVEAYDKAFARVGEPGAQHWSLFYARGIALERSKQWARAETDFLKALEFEPDQPYVLNYLGYSWVEQGKNLGPAEEMIRKAVSLRPNDGYIVDSLGWAYYKVGRYEDAVRELERAVELRPADPVINDHLGDAYWRVGRRQEARFQWRRALGFKPEADVAATIEEKLKKGLTETPKPGKDG